MSRKNKMRKYIVAIMLLIAVTLITSFQIIRSNREKIVYFHENAWLWEGIRNYYLFKDNIIIAQKQKQGEETEYFLYQVNDSKNNFLYKYINSKGDLDHAVPELAYWRFDLFVGGSEPFNCEYYNNDNLDVAKWFIEIGAIVCNEENKTSAEQLPEFIRESEWCSQVFLEKAKGN